MTDILIIEDTPDLAGLLRDFLRKEGFTAVTAASGEEGIRILDGQGARMVLLDIMLPGMDGFEVCRIIRETKNVPLFIMSARADREDKLNGLSLGADDYIEKPFDIDVLIAKVKACFYRNCEFRERDVLTAGNLSVDLKGRRVAVDGKETAVTNKEFELLRLFLENKGKSLNKEWIFNRIWGVESFSEPSTLTVHIKWLREKIEEDPRRPQRILTVWGVGYKFAG